MTVPERQVEDLAGELERARAGRETVVPPSTRVEGFSLADGYAVGRALAARRSAAGHRVVGQKIGLTYQAIWHRIGLRHPVWAPVYASGVHDGVDEVSVDDLLAPKVEIEVVVGFDRSVPVGATLEEITAAAGWIALGYELVDCHYPGWTLTPPDLIADFGCHAGLVIGGHQPVTAAELIDMAALEVTLRCDDAEVATGGGTDVLGGPAQAIEALLASPDARTIEAGDIVTTGALTRGAHVAAAGERWMAHPHGGPTVEPLAVRLT